MRSILPAALAGLLLLATGCGNDETERNVVAVSGTVAIDGRTLEGGCVTFVPVGPDAADRKPSVARVEPDGSFRLGNANPSYRQGVEPGRYAVTVLKMPIDDSSPGPTNNGPWGELPERYADSATTPIVVEVPKRSAAEFEFKFSSERAESETVE